MLVVGYGYCGAGITQRLRALGARPWSGTPTGAATQARVEGHRTGALEELREVLDELYLDDTVDVIEDMPANVVSRILRNSDPASRSQINQLLNYPKDSAAPL